MKDKLTSFLLARVSSRNPSRHGHRNTDAIKPVVRIPSTLRTAVTVILALGCSSAAALGQSPVIGHQISTATSNTEIETGEIRTLSTADIEKIGIRGSRKDEITPKLTPLDEECFLPPLNLITNPSVPADQLKIPAKARKEYYDACIRISKKQAGDAEKHLRKAVNAYPKYAAAWILLGQILNSQQNYREGRKACSQASLVNPSYVPGYLCLADIAARESTWAEVLRFSTRALELGATSDPVAYEYQAAANLKLHDLANAEKSALSAVANDPKHRDPRVHFVLAQIYEAKRDAGSEAVQLREYLKYCKNPADALVIQEYLAKLEKHEDGSQLDFRLEGTSTRLLSLSQPRWGPADIDEAVPPTTAQSECPLQQILEETSKRTEVLIENLQRFSANERIEQIEIGKNGKTSNVTSEELIYVAEIRTNAGGYPAINEYRSGNSRGKHSSVVDTGSAAVALIFHPSHLSDFGFRCEGLSTFRNLPAWQLRFEENADPKKAFQAIRIGNSDYFPRLKGRAWIAVDTYDVLRIETDLISAVPKVDLRLEHLIISYAPVDFQNHRIRLLLPESASLYIDQHGHRYERVHNFSQFQLFSVDAAQSIKEPVASKDSEQ